MTMKFGELDTNLGGRHLVSMHQSPKPAHSIQLLCSQFHSPIITHNDPENPADREDSLQPAPAKPPSHLS